MVTCTRCCLHKAMRIVNLVTTLLGIGVIIYSLWLLKKWNVGIAQLPLVQYPPKPWFMYTSLCMGIAVCFITICGQMIGISVSNSTLCVYIIFISSLLILQVGVIIAIFFKMSWSEELADFIDEEHEEFKSFLILHLTISRLILLIILVPQIKVLVLAISLWVIGSGPTHNHNPEMRRRLIQSFLVGSISDLPQTCSKCESFYVISHRRNFWSYVQRIFRTQPQRQTTLS